MKRGLNFCLICAVGMLCGFVACQKIQIASEERPPQEKSQKEKIAQEKTIPQGAPRQQPTQKKSSSAGIFQKITPQDTFIRTYGIDCGSFHGQVNAALQDYAKNHKGNSFQISRLGSDAVILRGIYLRDGNREKYVSILTIKPITAQKCQLQIKFDSSAGGPSSSNPDEAGKEIFQIIEKGTGRAAQ